MPIYPTTNKAPALLFADSNGKVYEHPFLEATVWDGSKIAPAAMRDFVLLGQDGELLLMPGRLPIGWDAEAQKLAPVENIRVGSRIIEPMAVAAVPAMGWTRTHLPAYRSETHAPVLPLYAYGAAAGIKGGIAVAAARTDRHRHWAGRFFNVPALVARIERSIEKFPGNKTLEQLARCSLEYRCRTAQNIFHQRWEGGLPVSTTCNAGCIGCISNQPPGSSICAAQHRLESVPSPDDVVAVAVEHLCNAARPVISFGQGCEGEPLLQSALIEEIICRVRKITRRGIIHINTNGSRPKAIARLAKAGLQSIRIALNSARPDAYCAYFRPRGYDFGAVRESIRASVSLGLRTDLNLLVFPGVNDRTNEVEALLKLLIETRPHGIQWRSLCIDPEIYLACLPRRSKTGRLMGIRAFMRHIKTKCPWLRTGNFNRLPV